MKPPLQQNLETSRLRRIRWGTPGTMCFFVLLWRKFHKGRLRRHDNGTTLTKHTRNSLLFPFSGKTRLVGKWPKGAGGPFLTAQMSVFMVFCVPHLPLAFQFVCGPGGGGAANTLEDKWKVSLYLVAPPQAAAGYSTTSSFCCRTTFEDICAVRTPPWSPTVGHAR